MNVCYASNNSATASSPNSITLSEKDPIPNIAKLKIKDFEKLIGRKLSLKEKLSYKIVQWKLKKKNSLPRKEGKSKRGDLAMILGIAGLVSIFIPYVAAIALPCAILAIIFGYSARKQDADDTHAKVGIILGWITIGVFVLALIVVLAILSSVRWY
jgi:small-conductance mechanosensitive channel